MIARWQIEPRRGARRALDERLLLAAPWLGRPLFGLAARFRPGSRLRRILFDRLIRLGFGQISRGEYHAVASFASPAYELQAWPDVDRPVDVEPVYNGPAGLVELFETWSAGFESYRLEPREMFDPGGHWFGLRADRVGLPVGGHIELRDTEFYVWQLEKGMMRRQWVLRTEAAMLALLEERPSLGS